MSMSRKDYIKIADSMHYYLGLGHAPKSRKWRRDEIIQALTNSMRGTNSRFDSGRFYRRCMQGCSDTEFDRREKTRMREMKQLAKAKALAKQLAKELSQHATT